MKGIVDRIIKNIVVLEVEDEMINIEKTKFPEEIEEGDIVKQEGDNFVILKEETEKRKKYIENLFNSLIKDEKNK